MTTQEAASFLATGVKNFFAPARPSAADPQAIILMIVLASLICPA